MSVDLEPCFASRAPPSTFRLTTFRIALTLNLRRPPPFRFAAFNHSSPFEQVCRILHIRRLVQARNPAQCYTYQDDLLSNVSVYLRIEKKLTEQKAEDYRSRHFFRDMGIMSSVIFSLPDPKTKAPRYSPSRFFCLTKTMPPFFHSRRAGHTEWVQRRIRG